jgi:hypothetical protein
LGKKHAILRTSNSNAKEVVEITEVSHRKLAVQSVQEALEKMRGGGGDNDVIDVEEKIRRITARLENKQRSIGQGGLDSHSSKISCKTLVPGTRHLLQAIERLVETADMIRVIRIHKTRWLLAVDNLIKVAMEKSILDIKLTNRPGAGDGKVENQANHGRLGNWTKSLIIVNSGTLRESTNNPASFIARKSPI